MPLTEIKVPIYAALITQSGVANPTVDLLQNTFPVSIIWTRNSAGIYRGLATGQFPTLKTIQFITNNNLTNGITFKILNISANEIEIRTILSNVLTDGLLYITPIQIQQYNL